MTKTRKSIIFLLTIFAALCLGGCDMEEQKDVGVEEKNEEIIAESLWIVSRDNGKEVIKKYKFEIINNTFCYYEGIWSNDELTYKQLFKGTIIGNLKLNEPVIFNILEQYTTKWGKYYLTFLTKINFSEERQCFMFSIDNEFFPENFYYKLG